MKKRALDESSFFFDIRFDDLHLLSLSGMAMRIEV